MEEKITAWIARDLFGDLTIFLEKPKRHSESTIWGLEYGGEGKYFEINRNLFPQVKWEDKEPTKVELLIKVCE